jgi:hypothetical protein
MLRVNRTACATVAWVALAGLAGITSVHANGENLRVRHAQRTPEGERHPVRRAAEARQSGRAQPVRAERARAAARQEAFRAHEHRVATYHQKTVARGIQEPHLANGSAIRESRLADGARVRAVSRGIAGGQVHVVRYGNALSGTVDRTIRPGFTSRTFVSGGHILYTHVYQRHVWHQFGRAFAYERFVPAVRYPAVYYAWALAPWPRAVAYSWGWQPWYPTFGFLFTPYPVYTSPDLWMTDYIIAQSMQAAYQAQTAAPPPVPSPAGPSAPLPPYPGFAPPGGQPSLAAPSAQPSEAVAPPQPNDAPQAAPQPSDMPQGPVPSDAAPVPQSSGAPQAHTPPAPVALPPAITPQVKAQLDAEIKVQLQEQQAAAATPAILKTQDTPPALRPNHVFFQVVEPLDVASGTANRSCSLGPNDYIKRIGGMSKDDWMIPVVVELSGPSDCPEGLRTRIGLNDLNAMENEQEAQVMEAMRAASKSLGPNGPPSGPGAFPTLIADGNAAPDPGALAAIRQAQ